MGETKRCTRCGEEKTLAAFSRNRTRGDGLAARCRECQSTEHHRYYVKNRDRILQRDRTRSIVPTREVTFPQLHDPEWLRKQYSEEFRSAKEIAEVIGCAPVSVDAALWRAKITRLPHALRAVLRARRDREREEGVAACS